MKIGIIGCGNVGGTLGTKWAAKGHEVVFGSRNPDSAEIQELLSRAPGTRAAEPAATAKECDVLLLATPWPPTQSILAGLGDLSGKILIDATNPIHGDLSGLSLGTTTSAGEQVAAWSPGAKVVKAFNTVGANVMENPSFGENPVALFFCGDDDSAKELVAGLVSQVGFEALDAGPLSQARLLEPFAMLWISLAYAAGHGREIAFRFLRR